MGIGPAPEFAGNALGVSMPIHDLFVSTCQIATSNLRAMATIALPAPFFVGESLILRFPIGVITHGTPCRFDQRRAPFAPSRFGDGARLSGLPRRRDTGS